MHSFRRASRGAAFPRVDDPIMIRWTTEVNTTCKPIWTTLSFPGSKRERERQPSIYLFTVQFILILYSHISDSFCYHDTSDTQQNNQDVLTVTLSFNIKVWSKILYGDKLF